jgi:hypothetical protein
MAAGDVMPKKPSARNSDAERFVIFQMSVHY